MEFAPLTFTTNLMSTILSQNYSPAISAIVTLLLTLILILKSNGAVQDIPNERSLHTVPVPRTGGIALMSGLFSGWILLNQFWTWWVVLPAFGLFVLSFLDDIRKLTPLTRLIGHFIAALIVVSGADISLLMIIPVLLFIVWMTNLYNFMDGSDGLAGGMALFGFGSYGVGAWLGGNEMFALLNFSVASAAFGFLVFNFHPAKVFMGDAGSIPLGFLAATLGVWGWQSNYWPFWFPLLVFSPFVADATITLLKRAHRGEKLSQAHRSHYYQRLVLMGWGHRNTAIAEYILMVSAGLSALWGLGLKHAAQGYLLLGWAIVYLALMAWIDKHWREYKFKEKKTADA